MTRTAQKIYTRPVGGLKLVQARRFPMLKAGLGPRERGGCALYPAVLAVLLCSGCSSMGENQEISYSKSDSPEASEFDRVSNPVPSAKTMYAYSRVLHGKGEDANCALALSNIIEKYPDFLPAYADLADLQVRHGKIGPAIKTLRGGLKVSPRDPVLHNNLGMCWMLKGEFSRALSSFICASAVNPQDARYRANMAAALGMLGRYEEALALFMQVLPKEDARHNLQVVRDARMKLTQAAGNDHPGFNGSPERSNLAALPLHTRPRPNTPASISQSPPRLEPASFTGFGPDGKANAPKPNAGASLPGAAAAPPSHTRIPRSLFAMADPTNPIEVFEEASRSSKPASGGAALSTRSTVAPSSHARQTASKMTATIVLDPVAIGTIPMACRGKGKESHDLDVIREACRRLVVVDPSDRDWKARDDESRLAGPGSAEEIAVFAAPRLPRQTTGAEPLRLAGQVPAWPLTPAWRQAMLPMTSVMEQSPDRFLPFAGR